MVKSKPSCQTAGNELKIPTDRNKGQSSKPKKYRGKKPRNRPILNSKDETDFQVWCTDLEGYTFYLGPRAPETFARTIKELERYLGVTYSDSFQPAITT